MERQPWKEERKGSPFIPCPASATGSGSMPPQQGASTPASLASPGGPEGHNPVATDGRRRARSRDASIMVTGANLPDRIAETRPPPLTTVPARRALAPPAVTSRNKPNLSYPKHTLRSALGLDLACSSTNPRFARAAGTDPGEGGRYRHPAPPATSQQSHSAKRAPPLCPNQDPTSRPSRAP